MQHIDYVDTILVRDNEYATNYGARCCGYRVHGMVVFVVDVPEWRVIVGRRLGVDAGYLLPVVLGARRAVHDETLAPFAALHELCVRIRVGEVEQAEVHVRFRARRINSAVVRVRSWKQATRHVLSLDRVNLQPGDWLTLPLNLMSI